MPAGKQKLQLGVRIFSVIPLNVQYDESALVSYLVVYLFQQGIFIKDSNTLAYYNVTPASLVQLQLKERGGRKK